MHRRLAHGLFALCGGLALWCAGCSGQGTNSGTPVATITTAPIEEVPFSIVVPAQTSAYVRKPAYVSASTKSATISVTPGNASTTVNCTSVCSGTIAAPAGSDTFTVNLYDAQNGTGNLLSTGTATQTIVVGQANTVSLTFNGVVASLSLSLNPTSVTTGTSTNVAVTANALDADGNTIVGPGSYVNASGAALTLTLGDSDTSGATKLSQTTLTAPTTGITLAYNGSAVSPNPVIS